MYTREDVLAFAKQKPTAMDDLVVMMHNCVFLSREAIKADDDELTNLLLLKCSKIVRLYSRLAKVSK